MYSWHKCPHVPNVHVHVHCIFLDHNIRCTCISLVCKVLYTIDMYSTCTWNTVFDCNMTCIQMVSNIPNNKITNISLSTCACIDCVILHWNWKLFTCLWYETNPPFFQFGKETLGRDWTFTFAEATSIETKLQNQILFYRNAVWFRYP